MDLLANEPLDLAKIRYALIRQEDTIIFKLIERAQFPHNSPIYLPSPTTSTADGDAAGGDTTGGDAPGGGDGEPGIVIPDWSGSFLDFVMHKSESAHALVRRYESPDELPFSSPATLPRPIIPSLKYPPLIRDPQKRVNVNAKIQRFYIDDIVPALTRTATADRSTHTGNPGGSGGRQENYGSAAVCDVECLQALSRRIHYGKFVAEVKFQSDRANMTRLMLARDVAGLEASITNAAVERQVLARLERKARTYGRDPQQDSTSTSDDEAAVASKVDPATVVAMYRDYVIPLTKEVEVEYLLNRLQYE